MCGKGGGGKAGDCVGFGLKVVFEVGIEVRETVWGCGYS